MFYRVVMNIVHVDTEIIIVPDKMLPKTPLPDSRLPITVTRRRKGGLSRQTALDLSGESSLDESPTFGEILIALRKRPKTMQVVGKKDPSVKCERMDLRHLIYHGP